MSRVLAPSLAEWGAETLPSVGGKLAGKMARKHGVPERRSGAGEAGGFRGAPEAE